MSREGAPSPPPDECLEIETIGDLDPELVERTDPPELESQDREKASLENLVGNLAFKQLEIFER